MISKGWNVARVAGRLLRRPAISSCTRRTVLTSSTGCDGRSSRSHEHQPLWRRLPPVRGLSTDEFESDDGEDVEVAKEENSPEAFRTYLYPNEQGPLFEQLNQAQSAQDVFAFLHKHQDELTPVLVSQAVMVLWDLQRIYLQFCTDEYLTDSLHELKNYIKSVSGHPDFESLMWHINDHYTQLCPDAITCVLLYLLKMGASHDHPVMQQMQMKCCEEFETYPLTALSRYIVASQRGNNMKTLYSTKDVLPYILQRIEGTEDAEEFRLLSICLCHLNALITPSIMEMFSNKTRELIRLGVIGSHTPRTLVKVLKVFNFSGNHQSDHELAKTLLNFMCGSVNLISSADIVNIKRSLNNTLEVSKLQEEIDEFVGTCLLEQEPLSLQVDLLNCSSSIAAPIFSIAQMEKIIEEHIQSASFPSNINPLFILLRSIKTPNRQLCDLYWNNVSAHLAKNPKDVTLLLGITFKYMHFNNNMGGTYRNDHFESTATSRLMALMRSPYRFMCNTVSRSAACLLAFTKEPLPSDIFNQVLRLAGQFTILDCHNMSRGIQISTGYKISSKSPEVLDQIVKLSSVISTCLRNFLNAGNVNLHWNDTIMRTYINIQGVPGTDIHEKILDNFSKMQFDELSGKTIKNVSNTLINSRCYVPEAVATIEQYIVKNGASCFGFVAERFLTMLYMLGHSSPITEESVRVAGDLILRDCTKLNSLALLQSALSLTFYNQLPMQLIHYIFTVDFLDRLDKELKMCYSRAVYPVKVRHLMMELNRAVCLDYPQADIPWFHEKYCQENVVDTKPPTPIHREVFHTLKEVMGGPEFIKVNSYSPYFYNIDFEVWLDEKQKPVNLRDRIAVQRKNLKRVAIIININSNYTNGVEQLCGPSQLKRKHLEMLGYHQVEISRRLWQAMYMSEQAARRKFMTNHIWPNQRRDDGEATLTDEEYIIT